MALNVHKTIVDAVWAALEDRTGFTSAVQESNRVKTANADQVAELNKRNLPAQFPYVYVLVTGDTLTTPQRTFGVGVADFDYAKRIPITIEVRCVFDQLTDSPVMTTETEIAAAIVSLDASLRGNSVRPAPMEWRHSRGMQPVNGLQRLVSSWITTTECRPYVSSLTA